MSLKAQAKEERHNVNNEVCFKELFQGDQMR